jgi:hypothetical protein
LFEKLVNAVLSIEVVRRRLRADVSLLWRDFSPFEGLSFWCLVPEIDGLFLLHQNGEASIQMGGHLGDRADASSVTCAH